MFTIQPPSEQGEEPSNPISPTILQTPDTLVPGEPISPTTSASFEEPIPHKEETIHILFRNPIQIPQKGTQIPKLTASQVTISHRNGRTLVSIYGIYQVWSN